MAAMTDGDRPHSDKPRRRMKKALLIVAMVVATACSGGVVYLKTQGVSLLPLITFRGNDTPGSASADERALWATPVDLPGVPNLHKVSEGLYRSAQVTPEGFARLKELGVKTVVNLRSWHSDNDNALGSGLAYEEISCNAWDIGDAEVVRFLKIATDPERGPVLVHCQHGADRTGTMCAAYRIVVQGWGKEQAIREMTHGGFGYHEGWGNLLKYLGQMDVQAMKSRLAVR